MITKRQGTTCQLSQAKVVSKIFYLKGQGLRWNGSDEKDGSRYWPYKHVIINYCMYTLEWVCIHMYLHIWI